MKPLDFGVGETVSHAAWVEHAGVKECGSLGWRGFDELGWEEVFTEGHPQLQNWQMAWAAWWRVGCKGSLQRDARAMARSGVGVATRQVRCGSRVVTFVVGDPPSFDAALRPSPRAVRELEAREDAVRVDEVCRS